MNIRDALAALGYELRHGDRYDEELKTVVRRFQLDCKELDRYEGREISEDGYVGRGTRELLAMELDLRADWFFQRGRLSPEYAVFLSYASKDSDRVAAIATFLHSHRVPVFKDSDSIRAGSAWSDSLQKALAKSQVVLLVLSGSSVGSVNVLIEIAIARHLDKPLLPVAIEEVKLSEPLEALAGSFQRLDLTDSGLAGELGEALLAALSTAGLELPKAPE